MSEKITEAVKVGEKGRSWTEFPNVYYLFVTQDKIIIADILAEASQPSSQGKAIAFGGVLGQAILHAHSARSDTSPKKRLRAVLEAYERTRDKSTLSSLSLDQILEADTGIEILEDSRIIQSSSVSKLHIKRPGRFMEGKINVTWEVSRTTLSGREYSVSYSREFIVITNRWNVRKVFPPLLEALQHFFPNLTIS